MKTFTILTNFRKKANNKTVKSNNYSFNNKVLLKIKYIKAKVYENLKIEFFNIF